MMGYLNHLASVLRAKLTNSQFRSLFLLFDPSTCCPSFLSFLLNSLITFSDRPSSPHLTLLVAPLVMELPRETLYEPLELHGLVTIASRLCRRGRVDVSLE